MSSTTTQSSGAISLSYSFVLKWTLNGKEVIDFPPTEHGSVIRSDLYQLESSKDTGLRLSDEEDVAIHCLVVAYPTPRDSLTNNYSAFVTEFQKVVVFDGVPDFTLPSDYENDVVFDFVWRGQIPNLTVDMAIEIIGETEVHKCDVLKIICTEYLMSNTTAENLRQILKAAIDYDLPHLERACTQRIVKGDFQIMKL